METDLRTQIEEEIKKALQDVGAIGIEKRTKLLNTLVSLYEKIGEKNQKVKIFKVNVIDSMLGIQYIREFTMTSDRQNIKITKSEQDDKLEEDESCHRFVGGRKGAKVKYE
jgi:hypothetical protein